MKIRTLTEEGREAYRSWLATRLAGIQPPKELLEGNTETAVLLDIDVDPERTFTTRLEFGRYVVGLLKEQNAKELLSPASDGLWEWLTIAFFKQFGRKVSKPWHYAVARKGHAGSLAYRHLARNSFEMYWRHGENAAVMLSVDMGTWGDLAEQLSSRQNIAYHRGYINAANALYMRNGKPRKGAAGRVKPIKKRAPGDSNGRGAAARLALTVRRLSRTYDTHILSTEEMLELLPKKEFHRFLA